jgi:hypothetical protein
MKPPQTQLTAEFQPDRLRTLEAIFPVEECLDQPLRNRIRSSPRQRVDHTLLAALLPVLVLFL